MSRSNNNNVSSQSIHSTISWTIVASLHQGRYFRHKTVTALWIGASCCDFIKLLLFFRSNVELTANMLHWTIHLLKTGMAYCDDECCSVYLSDCIYSNVHCDMVCERQIHPKLTQSRLQTPKQKHNTLPNSK